MGWGFTPQFPPTPLFKMDDDIQIKKPKVLNVLIFVVILYSVFLLVVALQHDKLLDIIQSDIYTMCTEKEKETNWQITNQKPKPSLTVVWPNLNESIS